MYEKRKHLIYLFKKTVFDYRFEERVVMAETIYNNLNDPLNFLFYNFLEWVLPKFVNLNKLFQSEKSVVAVLHIRMKETHQGSYDKQIS